MHSDPPPKDADANDLERKLRPEMERRRARADELAAAVRAHHAAALAAEESGDLDKAAALRAELQRLNRRCNQENRAWLKLVVQLGNANGWQ